MKQTLKDYLEAGQPILVLEEQGKLVPYQLTTQSLSGESSAINHRTPELFRKCLERLAEQGFNPDEFCKTFKPQITQPNLTLSVSEILTTTPQRDVYPIARIAAEIAREIHGEPVPKEKKMGKYDSRRKRKRT